MMYLTKSEDENDEWISDADHFLYCVSFENVTKIIRTDGSCVYSKLSLSEIVNILSELPLWNTGTYYLVNLKFLNRIPFSPGCEFIMINNYKIPILPERKKLLMDIILKMY